MEDLIKAYAATASAEAQHAAPAGADTPDLRTARRDMVLHVYRARGYASMRDRSTGKKYYSPLAEDGQILPYLYRTATEAQAAEQAPSPADVQ